MIKKGFIAIATLAVISVVFLGCKKDSNQGEIDRGKIEEYVLENQLDGEYTSNGVFYVIEDPGSVEHPNVGSLVTVSYVGYTLDGVGFGEGDYYETWLNETIIGWQEGVPLIGEGGQIKLIIPSGLAYGSAGKYPIGANEVLAFDITLLYFTNN